MNNCVSTQQYSNGKESLDRPTSIGVNIEQSQKDRLARIAHTINKTQAKIVRKALDEFLGQLEDFIDGDDSGDTGPVPINEENLRENGEEDEVILEAGKDCNLILNIEKAKIRIS